MPVMKIVADENIAQLSEYFSGFGDLLALPGRNITAGHVKDADVLLVRSVTPVDAKLLAGSRVRFVGTCTIGTDHLDIPWLDEQGICWAAAPGCNATAVVDYVVACLFALDVAFSRSTIGVVGCGAVGSRLAKRLQKIGSKVLHCDPFKRGEKYVSLETVLRESDVICLHTPLTTTGKHPTFHLLHDGNLGLLKKNAILLNAGRGAVIDNVALLKHLEKHPQCRTVLDVWENEPVISPQLLQQVTIATPHIAGYSVEGKIRGTKMIYQALCDFVGIDPVVEVEPEEPLFFDAPQFPALKDLIMAVYDPRVDSEELKRVPAAFDRLRRLYVLRREFSACRVRRARAEDRKILRKIGF